MNITQQLGFDVSNALSNLSKLDSAIDKHVGQLGKLSVAYDKLNTSPRLGNASAAIDQLAARTQSASARISQSTNSAASGFERLGESSNQSLSGLVQRVTAANLLSRGIANLTSALSDGVSGAVDYQRSLAEIQTIAPALQGDFEGLSTRIRALSDAFNAQLGDVSEGLYQTISNQVQGTSAQFDVLTTSLKFSKAAVTSTDQSVQLLTAAINGFGINTSQSEVIAAKLFKTIELGRTRADELSNSLGRVAKIADQSGVSFEEVLASLATITISGVKTSEAITQLRGVFTGLLKPTESMSDALTRVGFSSAEQATKILGFKGTLDALVQSTGGSTEALAELFPRVRGLSGVLNIASKDAEKFDENLQKISATTAKTLSDAYNIVIETDAEKVTAELNKLKNFLTEEFGAAVLSVGTSLVDLTGGTESLRGSLAGLIGGLGSATAALGTYTLANYSASKAANAGFSNISRFTKGLGGAVTGVLLAASAVEAYQSAVDRGLRDYRERLDAQLNASLRKIRETNAKQIEAEAAKWKRIEKLASESLRSQIISFNEASQRIRSANELFVDSLASGVRKTLEGRQHIIDQLFDRSDTARKQSLAASQDAALIQTRAEDALFNRTLSRFSLQEQFNKTLARSAALGKAAENALSSAKTTDDRTSAEAIFQRAESLEQQAASLASQLGDTTSLNRANSLLLGLTRQRTSALAEYGKHQKEISTRAERLGRSQRDQLASLQQRFAEITKSARLFGRNDPLSREDRRRNGKKLLQDLTQFQQQAAKAGLGLGDLIDLEQIKRQTERSLTGLEFKATFDPSVFSSMEHRLQASIDKVFNDRRVELIVDLVFEKTGDRITTVDGIIDGLEKLEKTTASLRQLDGEFGVSVDESIQRADDLVKGLRVAENQFRGTTGALNSFGLGFSSAASAIQTALDPLFGGSSKSPGPSALQDRARRISRQLQSVAQGDLSSISGDRLQAFREQIAALNAEFFNGVPDSYIQSLQEAVNQLDLIRQSADAARGASKKFNDVQFNGDKFELIDVDELQKKLDSLNLQKLQNEFEALRTSATGIGSALSGGINNAVASIDNAKTAMLALAQAAASVQVPVATVPGESQFRAAGGHIRGRDNVLASLSAGEHVTSARNSRRFAAELQAINAGITPAFRASGGVVNNTTVGDVNVMVDGSNGPSAAANDIARQLRRSIRQGVSRI